jgi:hypothetical protein
MQPFAVIVYSYKTLYNNLKVINLHQEGKEMIQLAIVTIVLLSKKSILNFLQKCYLSHVCEDVHHPRM